MSLRLAPFALALFAWAPLIAHAQPTQEALSAKAQAPEPSPRVLTLAEAIRTARAHQPQLVQAHAGTMAALARADESRAAYLPQLTGTAIYERETTNFVPHPGFTTSNLVKPPPGNFSTVNLYQFQAVLSQLIYDFGYTWNQWRAAQATARSQDETEKYTRVQITLGAQTAFFGARAARDLVGVARDTLENQNAHLRQTQGFVRAGTHPEIDLAQQKTNVANAEVQLINATNTYETTKAQLNQAMGVEGPTDYDVSSDTLPPVEGEAQTLDPLLSEALKRRPDFASLAEQARSKELTIRATRGTYLPSLGFSTGFADQGLQLDDTGWNWNAQVTLTWNMFQGGLTHAQVQEARANLDAARAQMSQLQQQIRVDVIQAQLAVRANKEALLAAAQALVNAKEQLRLAEGRYRTGVGNSVELSDAQVAVTNAAAQRVQAEYNLATSRAQLIRALGREIPDV